MSASPGSVWVEGGDLHFIDGSGTEYAYTGESISSPSSATTGSIWLDTDDGQVHYIDENGDERAAPRSVGSSVADAQNGSIWIENGLITYIDSGNKVTSHSDQSHSNKSFDDGHSDSVFGNDSHTDFDDVITPFEDGMFGDKSHSDFTDSYDDAELGDHQDDAHEDSEFGNQSFEDDHNDKAFSDFSFGQSFGNDSHNDQAFADEPSSV